MSIVVQRNDAIELNIVRYCASITPAQLMAFAHQNRAEPANALSDTLIIVEEAADFSAVPFSTLDSLREIYRAIYQAHSLTMVRLSAWLCQSPDARDWVRYWLHGRGPNDGFGAAVQMFDTLAEACDWLVLSPPEMALVKSGAGFREIKRIGPQPPTR